MENVIINFNRNDDKETQYFIELYDLLKAEGFSILTMLNSFSYNDKIEQIQYIEKDIYQYGPSTIYRYKLNDIVLIITNIEVYSRRISIYKIGVGEVGSLSIDETIKYLKNELNKYLQPKKIYVELCENEVIYNIYEYCLKEKKIMNNIDINEFLIEYTLTNYKIDKSKVINSKINKSENCPNYRVEINYIG